MTTPRPRGRPRTKPVSPAKSAPPSFGSFPIGHTVSRATQRRRVLLSKLAAHVSTVPTMPVITACDVTDADIGLAGGDIAQERAERFLRAAAGFNTKQAELKTLVRGIEVVVPDESLVMVSVLPTDPVERDILRELRRLTGLPPLVGLAD